MARKKANIEGELTLLRVQLDRLVVTNEERERMEVAKTREEDDALKARARELEDQILQEKQLHERHVGKVQARLLLFYQKLEDQKADMERDVDQMDATIQETSTKLAEMSDSEDEKNKDYLATFKSMNKTFEIMSKNIKKLVVENHELKKVSALIRLSLVAAI